MCIQKAKNEWKKAFTARVTNPAPSANFICNVYSYNLQTNKVELGKVLNTLERKTEDVYEVTTVTQKIHVTSEHPFYVQRKGWVTVKELKAEDQFKTEDETIIETVKNINSTKKSLTVYNIEIDGNHNYFVTGSRILVHNKHIQQLKVVEEPKEKTKPLTKNNKSDER